MVEITQNLIATLTRDLKNWLTNACFDRIVLGLSGGIDSALSAALAVNALGKENVFAYFLPYKDSNPESREDALLVANHLNIMMEEIDITGMADIYMAKNSFISPLRLGNLLSRLRMMILFDRSAIHNALVLGTGNKSELLLGYMTWFGDSACSVNPLGDLYKTQIWQMSKLLGLPQRLIDKAPSADHSKGQTDEGDLGYRYKDIDNLLVRMIERGEDPERLANSLGADFVHAIARRVKMNRYKRQMPAILSVGQMKI